MASPYSCLEDEFCFPLSLEFVLVKRAARRVKGLGAKLLVEALWPNFVYMIRNDWTVSICLIICFNIMLETCLRR